MEDQIQTSKLRMVGETAVGVVIVTLKLALVGFIATNAVDLARHKPSKN